MISSDDLIKYKNETGNSEHESIDFTQISSITNHIDDKLIVNGKVLDVKPSNYILNDYLVDKIAPKIVQKETISTYFLGPYTTVSDIKDIYVRDIMIQKKMSGFPFKISYSLKTWEKERLIKTVLSDGKATFDTRFLNGDTWEGSLGIHAAIGQRVGAANDKNSYYNLPIRTSSGKHYFIYSLKEFIHISDAQKYIENTNNSKYYLTGKRGSLKKDCSTFRCFTKKIKLYDEYYVTVSESKYNDKDNLLMINEKEFDKKYNTSLYERKNIINLESDWNGIVNSKKNRINISFLRQLKPILYDHEQNEFNWLTSFFILAYVYRFGISIIVLLVLATKWAMKTYFID